MTHHTKSKGGTNRFVHTRALPLSDFMDMGSLHLMLLYGDAFLIRKMMLRVLPAFSPISSSFLFEKYLERCIYSSNFIKEIKQHLYGRFNDPSNSIKKSTLHNAKQINEDQLNLIKDQPKCEDLQG